MTTDERLRSWLDANQLGRERLCAAILGLDGRFFAVQPRQPRGGPDGGWDIECTDKQKQLWRVGIGFRNSLTDSSSDRTWAAKKMRCDAANAAIGCTAHSSFIFMTNVNLAVRQREKAIGEIKKLG